ncbi:hypothetical protein ACFWP7_35405 [Streptomyces sp. NPDC058470]|uniref:hypothetical protein n=1 Tax=Streptomyces sp. NPDC058470 TaxID=3346515 RepID=UPI00366895EA
MTNPRNRELDRTVRAYKRAHPGITLDQARAAVAARSGSQPRLPARIPAAPLPRPAERLEGYIQRVAAAAGAQRHRAMELLGLEPGNSATDRLDELAAGPLPDHSVRGLVAATGMTSDQARALTAPRSAAGRIPDLENLARQLLSEKHIRPGGAGKTRTDAGDLARLLAETSGQRTLLFDLPATEPRSTPYTPIFVDLDWPADGARPPIDPEVFDEVAEALGIRQDTETDPPPRK